MEGPIPGESLTKEPRAAQYERPPKFAKPEEAFEAYLDKFDNPDNREGLMLILEQGMPLSSIVTVMTREAVRAGIHSIDTAVILRPMVHEYLRAMAKSAGVKVVEDVTELNKEEQLSKKERALIAAKVEEQMNVTEEPEPDDVLSEEMPEPEVMPEVAPAPRGLMSRKGV